MGAVNVTKEVIQAPDRPNGGVTRCPHEVSRGSLWVPVMSHPSALTCGSSEWGLGATS